MRKVLKWIGIGVAGLVGLLILAMLILYAITEGWLNKSYDIPVEPVDAPSQPEAIQRGQHLVTTLGFCTDCHGDNLAGQVFDDGPLIGRLVMSNLTSGKGGIGHTFTDTDWVRAIRHGVGPDGKPLLDMPANLYYNFSDTDLTAIIAYLKSLPPVDHELPEMMIGPMARLFIAQDPSLIAAQVINHTAPRPPAPQPSVTVEYGRYLAVFCTICHGRDLAGEGDPGSGLNLTPGGNLAAWSETDFIQAIRTGVTPDGRKLDPELMPWNDIGQLTDEDLKAIWLYLQSLPPIKTGM